MSATDELRRLLDERGVKYQKLNEHVTWVFLEDSAITFFSDELGVSAEVSYPKPVLNGTKFLTPEQAIAATLVDDAYDAVANEHVITAEQLHALLDEWDKHPGRAATDGEMMTYATLGGGECEFTVEYDRDEVERRRKMYEENPFGLFPQDMPQSAWTCSNCGQQFKCHYNRHTGELLPVPSWIKHCPNCGAKVVSA